MSFFVEYCELDPTPLNEECQPYGVAAYNATLARVEADVYARMLRRMYAPGTDGLLKFKVKLNPYEGSNGDTTGYYSIVVKVGAPETDDEAGRKARALAVKRAEEIESSGPENWDARARYELAWGAEHGSVSAVALPEHVDPSLTCEELLALYPIPPAEGEALSPAKDAAASAPAARLEDGVGEFVWARVRHPETNCAPLTPAQRDVIVKWAERFGGAAGPALLLRAAIDSELIERVYRAMVNASAASLCERTGRRPEDAQEVAAFMHALASGAVR